jgi:hypothetical protein
MQRWSNRRDRNGNYQLKKDCDKMQCSLTRHKRFAIAYPKFCGAKAVYAGNGGWKEGRGLGGGAGDGDGGLCRISGAVRGDDAEEAGGLKIDSAKKRVTRRSLSEIGEDDKGRKQKPLPLSTGIPCHLCHPLQKCRQSGIK